VRVLTHALLLLSVRTRPLTRFLNFFGRSCSLASLASLTLLTLLWVTNPSPLEVTTLSPVRALSGDESVTCSALSGDKSVTTPFYPSRGLQRKPDETETQYRSVIAFLFDSAVECGG
jgi:hypothetical protein